MPQKQTRVYSLEFILSKIGASSLTTNELDAIHGAAAPAAGNPFATMADVVGGAESDPVFGSSPAAGITTDFLQAMIGSPSAPNAGNPFATVADLTGLPDADYGDVSVTGGVWTIDDDVVTYAKLQDFSNKKRLLGSDDATPDPTELTVGTGLDIVGTALVCTVTAVTDEEIQNAVGAMVDSSLVYDDATPQLSRAALTGDVTAAQGSNATTIANDVVSLAKMANVVTASVFYRKTAGTGDPEVQTLATLKTDLGLTGTNSGDQTTITAISSTKAQFDTACSDGNFLYVGDVTSFTDEAAQDAIGAMLDTSLVYVDGTPLLTRAALTGAVTAPQGGNATALGSFTKAQLTTAVSDGDPLYVGDVTGYTDELAQDAVGAMVDTTLVYVDGTPLLTRAALTGDVTAAQGSNATTIANDAVTFAKIQNITDARLLGRSAGSSGDAQEITVGTGLSLVAGALTGTGFSQVVWRVFTATGAGTYTPTAGMKYCIVYVTGGGGASLDCTGTDAVTGGGGAGGTAIKVYSAATIGVSKPYTVGAAGVRSTVQTQGTASDFASSDIVGNGGFSSAAELAGATTNVGYAGSGGSASGGTMNINGGAGTPGIIVNTTLGVGGTGGSSFWGGGRCATGSDAAGVAGLAYGSGAAGAHAAGATDRLGANGADGVVVVIEYI